MIQKRKTAVHILRPRSESKRWEVGKRVYHYWFVPSENRWVFQGTAKISAISGNRAAIDNGDGVLIADGNAFDENGINLKSYYSLKKSPPKTRPFLRPF